MKVPAIIIGEVKTVLRLPPSLVRKPERWTQLDSDIMAHFIQVHQQIERSKWSKSELRMSGDGSSEDGITVPTFEDFVFAAVYFRQLTMEKDDLFNASVEIFCKFSNCNARIAWIREEQKEFNDHLDSECFFLPGYSLRDLFDAFIYGASLMHQPRLIKKSHRERFLKIYDSEPRPKVLFALNGSLRTLLNPVGNAAVLIFRELSHWIKDNSLPLPNVRWHAHIFESKTQIK